MFGAQIQMTYWFAPSSSKMSCTWRHIFTKSPLPLPLSGPPPHVRSPQGYQEPFISWSRRIARGRPFFTTSRAYRCR